MKEIELENESLLHTPKDPEPGACGPNVKECVKWGFNLSVTMSLGLEEGLADSEYSKICTV